MEDTHDYETGRGSGFLIGLLCGAAVGATVGLLLAPKTGSELRRDLADGAGRLRRRAEKAYNERHAHMDHISDAIEDGVSQVSRFGEDMMSRGRKAGQRVADQARSVMGDARRGTQGNGSENPIS